MWISRVAFVQTGQAWKQDGHSPGDHAWGKLERACKPALRVYLRQFANKHGKAHHVFDRKKAQSYKNNTEDVACLNYFNRIQLGGMDPDALERHCARFR
ncbi:MULTISPECIES: DUF4238 domain-containing protein [unclassified Bradyrhizobium]|uniref:DUF4238 domain-containing protein n=1 Tax=unclassified Bradyrhizobium TaxID=2631580 RepID=UPI0023CE816F|nr:DUF4238 domain-containing protein [Bradyrhizobium sp. CSS354]